MKDMASGVLYAVVLVGILVSVFILILSSQSCEERGNECYFNPTMKHIDIFYIVISSVGSAVFLIYAVILACKKITGNGAQSEQTTKHSDVLKKLILFIFTCAITVKCIIEIVHKNCMNNRYEEAYSSGYINKSCAYNPKTMQYNTIDRVMHIIFCIIQCGFIFSTINSKFNKSFLVQVFSFTIYMTNSINLVHILVESFLSAKSEDQRHFHSCLLPGLNITECPVGSSYSFFKSFGGISEIELSFLCMILMFELASVDGNSTNEHQWTSVNNTETSSRDGVDYSIHLLPSSGSSVTDMMIHRQSFCTICFGIVTASSFLLAMYFRISILLEDDDTFIISNTTDKSEVLPNLSINDIGDFVYQMVTKAVMIALLMLVIKMKSTSTHASILQLDSFHNFIISVSYSASFIGLLVQLWSCMIIPLTPNTILIAVKNVVTGIEISLQRFALLKIYHPCSPLSMVLILFVLSCMNGELWVFYNWYGITPDEHFVGRQVLTDKIEEVVSKFVLGFLCFFHIESLLVFYEWYCAVKIK